MCLSPDKPAMARPSLYATARLARMVQQVKERLKCCKHRKSSKMASEDRPVDNFVSHARQLIDG